MKAIILILLSLIAFNTNSAVTSLPEKEFYLEEEEYVDDIPFNTCKIAADGMMEEAMAVEFTMEDEETVNDLPFDTEKIAQKLNGSKKSNELLDLNLHEDNSTKSNSTDFIEGQTSSNKNFYVIGILLIILMSAYSMAAFLL